MDRGGQKTEGGEKRKRESMGMGTLMVKMKEHNSDQRINSAELGILGQ